MNGSNSIGSLDLFNEKFIKELQTMISKSLKKTCQKLPPNT